jgi:crotonobetainyl-CoA:carnitine CoA-transferase CaiB-like acyl-CoA transferase
MTRPQALSGVLVLELGQVIAGTYCGTILADLGADVLKVEPLRGDLARNPGIAAYRGESTIHLAMNRGKRSIAVNLKAPEGREIFEDLVRRADVVIDNFRPGVLDRLELGFERLKQLNEQLVTCSITGFGQYGPAADRPAFDLVVQAMSGHLHITGDPAGDPARVGIPLADMAGSMFACISVLAGLCGRHLHGTGARADVSMLDSLVSMLGYDGLYHLNTGNDVTRHGSSHAHMVPWQAFATSDSHLVVAAREEKFWGRLCKAIGRPDLIDDPRTRSNAARVANRAFAVAALEEAFASRTRDEWLAELAAYDIPAAPVNTLQEALTDPQVLARGVVRTYDHPTLGPIRYTASPMQFEGWEFPNRSAPMLGQHTVETLRETLGYSEDQAEQLLARGIVAAWPGAEPA